MPHKESLYPIDWLRIAEKDLSRVQNLLSMSDAEAAGFFLQQAIEKFLKAFLLSKGWKLHRIHDLEPLLNEAIKFDGSLENYRLVLQKITGFYFIDRYPFILESGINENDVQSAFEQIEAMVNSIRIQMKDLM